MVDQAYKTGDASVDMKNGAKDMAHDVKNNVKDAFHEAKAGVNERRAEDAAKLLGLDGLLDRMPKQLSGGQRQRVAMGRAIVREPSVFLFDEPLSNLDANLRNQMRIELRRLHQRLATTSI